MFGSLYRLGAFNGDPHPGNYLFQPGGRVTFLDFGLVKQFTADEIDVVRSDMIEAMVIDRDLGEFRAVVEDVGLLRRRHAVHRRAGARLLRPLLRVRAATTSRSRSPRSTRRRRVRRFFDATGPHGEIMRAANVPPAS